MSGCRILGDSAVHDLLINLSKTDLTHIQQAITTSLHQFSTTQERQYQPSPGIINRPTGQKTLFRPFTSPTSVGTKIIVDPAPDPTTGSRHPLHGVLVICDNQGIPRGLINAEEVTGFRTSLSAVLPWMWRERTEEILVFGAGKQALWHLRLAVMMREGEIRRVTVVNRSRERAEELVRKLKGKNEERWNSEMEIGVTDWEDREAWKEKLRGVDVVFCTVPSKEVLFEVEDLKLEERKYLPYVSAIGSWQKEMIELDPELLKIATTHEKAYRPNKDSSGVVLVDDRDSVVGHTGEGLQSGLQAEQYLELGEVFDLHKSGGKSEDQQQKLSTWMKGGLVVYKSVGVSLTDLATGEAILKLAEERDIGTLVMDL